ncbi:MAG: penicillin-binding protein 1A [Pseudomonadota bacterium]
MKLIKILLVTGCVGLAFGMIAVFLVVQYYRDDLPDVQALAQYEPPLASRIYASDGRILARYSRENRVFLPIDTIPITIQQAFIAAEDQRFRSHFGVDVLGIARAFITNVRNLGSGARLVGGSSITQQVAKNILLDSSPTLERKIKEALLSLRMEQVLSKDKILELYLNEIYLGRGAYGVAAAALTYFDKSVLELSLGEIAYLAGVPKAPSQYDPDRQPERALQRRNYVLRRLLEESYVTHEQVAHAIGQPLRTRNHQASDFASGYFTTLVQDDITRRYGENALFEGGLAVMTTLETRLQAIADRSLRAGLIAYDRRYGYRGALGSLLVNGSLPEDWQARLATFPPPPGLRDWHLAAVLTLGTTATVGLQDGSQAELVMADMTWARANSDGRLGRNPRRPSDVFTLGDVVLIADKANGGYELAQIPEIQGGLVAIDPHNGRILALSGGFDFQMSPFNRVTQALRQPGSAFKPFVYLTGLEENYQPNHILLDSLLAIETGSAEQIWRPRNYSETSYGPTPMRIGVEKSRNLMTIRLALDIGIEKITDLSQRFEIYDNPQPYLSFVLGAQETTLLKLSTAYASIVNGGYQIKPVFIDRIQDRRGQTVYRHDTQPCPLCRNVAWSRQQAPALSDSRDSLINPVSTYQLTSMMEGVIERGTAQRLKDLPYTLAGKTGTTNEERDAWFIGFSPDLVVGVYTGFDTPRPLGKEETGSRVAVPIFASFMKEALKGLDTPPFRVPPGVSLIPIDPLTGERVLPSQRGAILEAFRQGFEPETHQERDRSRVY